jgi:predicted enzyme related to lactoylglutathione lyase
MHGSFFWYDLMTTDTKAAATFYGDVVGWGTQAAQSPVSDYSLFTVEGQGIIGFMTIPEDAKKMGMPPCWMGYIAVDDVDAAAAKLEKLGGKVHKPPQDIPGIIRFAVVADPQGAGFIIAKGLIKDRPMPSFPANTPGTVGWHELYAANGNTIFEFYEKMFGWTKSDAMDMGPMGVYQMFKTGGEFTKGGIMTKPPEIPVPHWGYYFNVPAIDAAVERVTKGGGKILNGPMEVPGPMWIIQGLDPQGAAFALVAPKR